MDRRQALVVLLVDDQAIVGEVVRRQLLDQADIAFHHCANSNEAVAVAQQVHPTVILQDLTMPGIDGLSLIADYRAASATENVPIIVLSSKEEPLTKQEAFRRGANDYLVKPPEQIELVARIRLHSSAYLNQIQRDEAYIELTESQRQLVISNTLLAERISELNAARDKLAHLVNYDSLSGLCSRRHWFERAAAEFSRFERYKHPLPFLMLDLDFFKRINDTFGHDAGDAVIRQFGHVLHGACRQVDVAGRIGGEEFSLFLPETPMAGAEEVARRIVMACRSLEVSTAAGQISFSCSIGIAQATAGDRTADDVLKRADQALYEAKCAGRNGWKIEVEARSRKPDDGSGTGNRTPI